MTATAAAGGAGGRRSAGDAGSGSGETCERVPSGPDQFDEAVFKVTAQGYDAVQVVRPDDQYPFVTLFGPKKT